MGYKGLSLIQTVFITLAGISVFDYGFATAEGPTSDGIMFNQILFAADGLVGEILADLTLWGMIQFWGYCFIIVAMCQLIKSITVNVES